MGHACNGRPCDDADRHHGLGLEHCAGRLCREQAAGHRGKRRCTGFRLLTGHQDRRNCQQLLSGKQCLHDEGLLFARLLEHVSSEAEGLTGEVEHVAGGLLLGRFLPFNTLALLLGKLILLALIRLQLLGHRLFTLGHVVSLLLSEVIRLLLAVLLSQFPQALIAAATQLGLADLHTVDFCQALLMGEAQLVKLTGELHVQGTETSLPLIQQLLVVGAGITRADRLRGLVLRLLTNPEALLAIRLLNPVYLCFNLGAALLELRQGSAARRVAQNGIEQADAAECLLFRRLFDLVIQILEFVTQVPKATAHAVNGAWVVRPTIEQRPPVADGIAELFGQPVDLIRCPQHSLGK
ncbi:hypothetical protein D3C84_667810 [compost metagenome]